MSAGGVDLTFATDLAAGSQSEGQIPKLRQNVVFAGGPLILTFAKLSAGTGSEYQNRTTSLYIKLAGLNRTEIRHAPFDAAAARQDRK